MKTNNNLKPTRLMSAGLLLAVFILLAAAIKMQAQPFVSASLVDLTEVKNLGVSASNESKSILQMQWAVNAQPPLSIKSFDAVLEVAYADGTIERFKTSASSTDRKARFEVPTLHLVPGRLRAELRSFKAALTANFTETTIKQGNF
ncbi:MAG: hypothetical protein HY231_20905 [Acidobacteria bacterium]|nr:hypothetical protein [Acidobacteriota bacterium]